MSASPFDPGGLEDAVSETGVVVVGVLAVVGILGAVGGLVLWIQNRQARDGSELEPAAWLWFVAGGFLLVAPLTAVLTWPADGLSFWSSAGGGNISVGTGAGAGWYLSLVAGAMLGVAGLAWLVRTEPGDEGADPEATATTGAPEAND